MSVHPSPELRYLFEAALNEFEKRAGTNLVQHPTFNNLLACGSIESVLDILQQRSKPLRTSLGDDATLMKWIKRTVHVLHSLSTNHIVVDGVGSAFPPAKAVFAAIAILLSAIKVKDVDKSYDTLVDIFESFESFLRRLDIYTKVPSTTAITEVIVKILTELLSTISLAIQQVKQGRLKKLGRKLLGENDGEVEAILQRLDRLTLEEAQITGTRTLEIVYDLLKNMKMVMDDRSVLMDDIHRTLVDMQQVASNMNRLRRDELQKDVRRWLSPPDSSINHNTARNAHHKGSAEWFIYGKTFTQWKIGTGSLLWVYGKPGSGKTILSSSIIDDITRSHKTGLASIAFFYFDFKDEAKKNARGALSSLLIQLAAQSDAYSEILSALYSENHAGSKQPTDDELRESLKGMLAVPDQAPIYIVIDALDECPNSTGTPSARENVLGLVEWLLSLRCSNLWVSVASRPERDIVVVLQPLTSHTISLHNETGQSEDISNYIKWFVNSDPKASKWRRQDKELVIEKLSERANGMFRWVFCQLDRLRRCIGSRIQHALDELPGTLDETYERTLLDIDKENWVFAHRLFQCLVVALRPLRVEELAEFLAFEFEEGGTPIFQADCRPEDPREAVLSTCSSLIAVVDDDGSAIVQFFHFTVKEYLTSTRIAEGRVLQYYTSLEPAHFLVTRACLSILLQLDDQATEEPIKDFPLVEYAAEYWVKHAKFGNAFSQTEDMVNRLFDPRNPHFAPWSSIHRQNLNHSWREYSQPTPLYYAALLNLRGVTEWLVNTRSQNINASGGYHGTPLHAASATGSLEVARFLLMRHANDDRVTVPRVLLDQGANINAINDHRETPLAVAIKYGPTKTVMETTNLLLDFGANPNLTGWDQRPIYAALSRGHRDVVQLLLRHGADIETQNDSSMSPLHVASERGHLRVAQGLLELGADINSRDDQGKTPLHLVQWGEENDDIGLLLLERGADPCVRDDDGQTPLHAASRSGSLKGAQLLLQWGAHISSRDNTGKTPLHVIKWRDADVALLLLERGADPGVRDDAGQTPLHVASRLGSLKFAQRLLDLSLSVNSQDIQGRTPLHEIEATSDDVALLLLERGADPGIRDDDGQTPLHVASRRGMLRIAQLLLQRGAHINSRDNTGQTPLHAINWRDTDVDLLLLESGADPGVQDDAGQTPLHVASQFGSLKFAERLLELGADINLRDNQGRTPLHVIGCRDVALLLLERGADPSACDSAGQTPLHLAPQMGSLDFAQRLLELGVNVNSQDNQGRTPLHVINRWRNSDVALLLLERGADPGIRDDAGQTPLHVASRDGSPKFAQQLLELGADVNLRDNQGRTPLHVISREDVALQLLERSADPSACDSAGQTLLHIASQMGSLDFAQRLLELGVNVNSQDNQGRTPLHVIKWRSSVVALLLLEHGADPSVQDNAGQTPLHVASQKGSLEFAQRLLELGVSVNSQDNQGRTPLHVIESWSSDVALLLLERGADPGVQDNAGQTPLHVASRKGSLKVTQRLLELGVSVNSQDNQGRTPLHVIECQWSRTSPRLTEGLQVPRLLLESGADPSLRDNDGHTLLHATARWGKLKVTQRFQELGLNLVDRKDKRGRTGFDRAAEWCRILSLLLLKRGADSDAQDNYGQTPLHVASHEGNLSVAQQLLKFDVDVNLQDYRGRTPFHMAIEGGHRMVERLLLLHGAERP